MLSPDCRRCANSRRKSLMSLRALHHCKTNKKANKPTINLRLNSLLSKPSRNRAPHERAGGAAGSAGLASIASVEASLVAAAGGWAVAAGE